MSTNSNLNRARAAKNDEFYTRLPDIENELAHYKGCFAGKVVYCNCDDPRRSNFVRYFVDNFKALGLRMLIASHYKEQSPDVFGLADPGTKGPAHYMVYKGGDMVVRPLKKDGDFRSKECTALLRRADIVVTNPPFSLFGDHMAQLIRHNKEFLVIGNPNVITQEKLFLKMKQNKIWLGYNNDQLFFDVPAHYNTEGKALIFIYWYTNLRHGKKIEKIELTKKYNKNEYKKYYGYDAINVNKIADIPIDYDGKMGVPITFMAKYNTLQFEIIRSLMKPRWEGTILYKRIIIRHRKTPKKQNVNEQ